MVEEPQRIARLTPVADVLARIDALVKPIAPREVEIVAAIGHAVAGDVMARPRPAAPIALRDGWAVSAEATRDAGSYTPAPLPAAARIDVGEPLPNGADAVAPLDEVALRAGRAQALAPVVAGDGVLPAGADCDPQVALLPAGRRLGPVELAALTAAGVTRIAVRAPRLLIVRARRGYDTVLDAARELIVRAVAADGGVVHGASAGDLAAVPADIDAVIVIGGTGSGRNDGIVRTLARVGRLEVHGIALAPGETAAFGFAQERPVLLLPGRLDAALAVWLVLGRPMLARLSCAVESAPPLGTRAVLARKVASLLSMTELVPVRCTGQKAEPIASGYWPLQAIAQANGWILVPADSEGYPAGAEVVVRPWP